MHTETELKAFLEAFEGGVLPKAMWTHAAHVTVAAAYLWKSDPEAALPRMRAAILFHNTAVGTANTPTSGYHETLTVFWLHAIHRHLRAECPPSRIEAVRAAVEAFGSRRDIFREYYSFDVVKSTEARAEWVAPDLQIL